MAKYRQIHTTYWNDSLILDLTPEQKYFYIYLLTNPNVKQCGIYEISLKQITYQTGYNIDTVLNLLDLFQKMNKIIYSKETNEIAVINFLKYNNSDSPSIKKCIEKDLCLVKNKDLIKAMAGESIETIDTVSIRCVSNNKNNNKNNNTNNNNKVAPKKFLKPSIDELKNYLNELGNNTEAEIMYDYYESKGWKVGNANMKDWKSAARNWLRRMEKNNTIKYPDYYSEEFSRKLQSEEEKLKYRNHLFSLGWECVYNPAAGNVWRKKS